MTSAPENSMANSAVADLSTLRVALIGNPNTGKTTLFNALTGLSQRTGNYPGVTVERKIGRMSQNLTLGPGKMPSAIDLIDLPGTYSLSGRSPDELVAIKALLGLFEGEQRPELVVVVMDACQAARSSYLVTQIMDLGLPVLIALNMMDLAEARGLSFNLEKLQSAFQAPLVTTSASRPETLEALKQGILDAVAKPVQAEPQWTWPEAFDEQVQTLHKDLQKDPPLLRRALLDKALGEQVFAGQSELLSKLEQSREKITSAGLALDRLESETRYQWIEENISVHVQQSKDKASDAASTLDAILLHKLLGPVIFAAIMTFIFVAIFSWADPFVGLIEGAVEGFGGLASAGLEATGMSGGPLESLITDGIIAGVGGVIVFLPQIIFLFLFLAILEDCGYMARAAFLMDRLLRFCGLSGHSFVPLMSSFACAVPGVMSARTISDPKDRLVTILVAPLMSCSARIPVYAVMIAAFVPNTTSFLGLSTQGLVFAGMYFLGILVAIPVAWSLKTWLGASDQSTFLMELPSYKWPTFRNVFTRVYLASSAFIVRAGTIILVSSIIIWALCYFPRSSSIAEKYEAQRVEAKANLKDKALKERVAEIDQFEQNEYLSSSFMGRAGQALEPAFKPAGWNWQIGVAVLASFPAREVIISVLGILYDLGGDIDEESEDLPTKMKASKWPDGRPVFNLPVALSILVFFALCMQCAATLSVVQKETNSWKWTIFAFVYMTLLAYVGAIITYQGTMALGWGA